MQKTIKTKKTEKKDKRPEVITSLEAFLKGDNKALVKMLKQTDISWEDVK